MSAKATSAGTDRVILKLGDVQVTESEFESRIAAIEPQGAPDKDSVTEKERRKLGDDYASVLMLSQQAVANHLDSSPTLNAADAGNATGSAYITWTDGRAKISGVPVQNVDFATTPEP